MSPKRRDDSVLDDLMDVFSRLPWWTGVPAVVLTYVGVTFAVGQFPLLAPSKRTLATVVAGLIALTAILGQVLKRRRRGILRLGSTLEGIRSLSWHRFEELVQEAFRREGFQVRPTASGADGGVDLVLRKGNETTFVQCKAWRSRQVGVVLLRELFGVVAAEGADAGVVVTSGRFSKPALEFADGKRLRLIDGQQLIAMLDPVRRDLPPTPDGSRLHPSCPRCGSEMVVRTAQKGPQAGNKFLGCTRYPKCRGTRNLVGDSGKPDVQPDARALKSTSTSKPKT